MKNNVAITGLGVISSIGMDIEEFTESLKSARSGIDKFEVDCEPKVNIHVGAMIKKFSISNVLKTKSTYDNELVKRAITTVRRGSFSLQCAVLASLEAWHAADLIQNSVAKDRIGLIVAGSNLTSSYEYEFQQRFRNEADYLPASFALNFMDTNFVGTLSEIFNIHGEGFTVGGASASGNVGIIKGFQLVESGVVDVCLVVGSMTDLTPIEMQGFMNTGGMGGKDLGVNPKCTCRPFDKQHDGFIYGQGCGCLILENKNSANRRNAKVLGNLLGGSIILDGNRLSNPNEDGEVNVMEKALELAKVSYQEIDYVNAHATSTPLGDITEVNAIKRVLKERISKVWINSTKSLTGHCLYGAGVIEGIASIIQMNQGFVHANLNLEEPIDGECRFCGKQSIPCDIKTVLSNSFGFGGINTSIVIRKEE